MSTSKRVNRCSKKIIVGTTVGLSAMALLRGQLAWFRQQGWDVTLVSSPDPEAERAARREQVSFYGIQMKRSIDPLHDIKAAIEWVRLIKRERPDVVNLGTPKASLLGIFAARVCQVPKRIYTIRGLRLEGTSGIMQKLLWSIEWLTISMATDVIAVSPSLGRELERRKLIQASKVWVIGEGSSNGVDATSVQNRVAHVSKNTVREQVGIDPAKFVVGYIGRVSSTKGVNVLLEALQREELENNVDLLIVGTVEDAALAQSIKSMGDRIHQVSWTDDVWDYLPAMDLLCLPTLREGFPNTVIEAAAAGIPAITTRATGAVDSVVDGETGFLVDVGDSKALGDRLVQLIRDSDLRHKLGLNAKQRVEEKFAPVKIWRGIEAIAQEQLDVPQVKRLNQYVEGI